MGVKEPQAKGAATFHWIFTHFPEKKKRPKKCANFSYEKQIPRRRRNPHTDARLVGMPCAKVIIWRSHLVAATPSARDNGARSSTLVGGCCDQPQKWQVWHSAWQRLPELHSRPSPSARTMKTQLDETRQCWALKKLEKTAENYFLENCRRMVQRAV